ncbi:hypothetical protein AY600_05265 [Phormidium willei BDU 130791]|nr:hypothetical protein AY600_05265 [Phormidium willei BDU 130791]
MKVLESRLELMVECFLEKVVESVPLVLRLNDIWIVNWVVVGLVELMSCEGSLYLDEMPGESTETHKCFEKTGYLGLIEEVPFSLS